MNPLGITLSQSSALDGYVTAFSLGGIYSDYSKYFLQNAQFNPTQVIGPQDILAAESAPPKLLGAFSTNSAELTALPGTGVQGQTTITLSKPLVATVYSGQQITGVNLPSGTLVVGNAVAGSATLKLTNAVTATGGDLFNILPLTFALTNQAGTVTGSTVTLTTPLSRMLPVGSEITGTNIPANTYLTAKAPLGTTTVSISQPALADGAGTWTFNPPPGPLVHLPGSGTAGVSTITLSRPLNATVRAAMQVTGTNIPAGTTVLATAPIGATTVSISQPVSVTGSDVYTFSTGLTQNSQYSYIITAYSNNDAIPNSPGVIGETLPSTPAISVTIINSGDSVQLAWNAFVDPNTAGYNVYRYDGAAPTSASAYSLIAHLPGASTTRYTDIGAAPQAQQITPATASNYGFNPLSEYYTQELLDFFSYYETNTFVLDYQGVTWQGHTVTNFVPTGSWNSTHAAYTVLQLTAQQTANGVNQNDVVNVYQPIFASNTRYVTSSPPPMPSWLIDNNINPHESPSQMVFACDGVFASNSFDPDLAANDSNALGGIENAISSAFNRGIAVNFTIPPNNWAAFPLLQRAPLVDTAKPGTLPVGTYYYAVTAVSSLGETTPSLEVAATVTAVGQSVSLKWLASTTDGPTAPPVRSYRVYRGTSPDNLTLIATVNAGALNAPVKYWDQGGQAPSTTTPPYGYYRTDAGANANYYAAYVQSNSSLNPAIGVSINGLSYGFPFSDQGGLSTNLDFARPENIPASLTISLEPLSGPGFFTQSLPDAVVNKAYSQQLVATGPNTPNTFSAPQGSLPAGLTLSSTGLLSGTPDSSLQSQTYNVLVTVTDAQSHQSSRIYVLNLVRQAQAILSFGDATGRVALPSVDALSSIPVHYEQFQIAGGVGPFKIVYASAALPLGLHLVSSTSQTGTFEIAGTPLLPTARASGPIVFQIQDSLNLPILGSARVGSKILTLASTAGLAAGMTVSGLGIPTAGVTGSGQFATYITEILNGTQVQLSRAANKSSPAGTTYLFCTAVGNMQPHATPVNPFSILITVNPPFAFTTNLSLPAAVLNQTYSQQIAVNGKRPIGQVIFVSTDLPSWLRISPTGLLTTAPSQTAPGPRGTIYSFTIKATNSEGKTVSEKFKLKVGG